MTAGESDTSSPGSGVLPTESLPVTLRCGVDKFREPLPAPTPPSSTKIDLPNSLGHRYSSVLSAAPRQQWTTGTDPQLLQTTSSGSYEQPSVPHEICRHSSRSSSNYNTMPIPASQELFSSKEHDQAKALLVEAFSQIFRDNKCPSDHIHIRIQGRLVEIDALPDRAETMVPAVAHTCRPLLGGRDPSGTSLDICAGDVQTCQSQLDPNLEVIHVPEADPEWNDLEESTKSKTGGDNSDDLLAPTVYATEINSLVNPIASADRKFPRDSYSFLALYGPTKPGFFLFGLLPFVFQMIFLWLLLDPCRFPDNDNPDSGTKGTMAQLAHLIPANVSPLVRYTQITSIAAYVIFPESSLQDVITAFRCFPRPSQVGPEDPVRCMRFSCLLRGIQGILVIVAALFLVISSDTVVDIILNFTAVNFISKLDNSGFYLALSGDFGPVLRREAERISHTDLPACMYKASKHVYYRLVVTFVSVVLLGILGLVIFAQQSNHLWITRTLRVQFDEPGLSEYSGCFGINDGVEFFGRHTYNSFDQGNGHATFGYCIEDSQWILFEGSDDTLNPCEARERKKEIARSSKTGAFDIATSFDEPWVSASNTPLDLYFFHSGDEEDLHCDLSLNDGVCDIAFNLPAYNYDGGDCCAATCTQPNCGRQGLTSVLGSSNATGNGFPHCIDPQLVPIAIRLNSLISSRDFAVFESEWDKPWNNKREESEWRRETPVNPYFTLECNGITVLTSCFDQTMIGKSETVMIDDGADCTLTVQNTTTTFNLAEDEPVWYVDYTLFHEETHSIEILTQTSMEEKATNFQRIPECYFQKLASHIDVETIYQASEPSHKAIHWLLNDDGGHSQCEDYDFIERYALTTMMFTMGEAESLISDEDQCKWSSVTCKEGHVQMVELREEHLEGKIPSEIGLLEKLDELQLSSNQLSDLPTEIGLLTGLRKLQLDHNRISSIPAEIGRLTNLKYLILSDNRIASLPTEMGLLTNLQVLHLDGNDLNVDDLPREIDALCSDFEVDCTNKKTLAEHFFG